jgi:hypothetical protein
VTSLALAVEKREWRLVSLYLLLGVSDAASRLPPETLSELVDLLGGTEMRPTQTRMARRGR